MNGVRNLLLVFIVKYVQFLMEDFYENLLVVQKDHAVLLGNVAAVETYMEVFVGSVQHVQVIVEHLVKVLATLELPLLPVLPV